MTKEKLHCTHCFAPVCLLPNESNPNKNNEGQMIAYLIYELTNEKNHILRVTEIY